MRKILILISLIASSHSFAQTVVYFEDFDSGLPLVYTIVDNDGLTPDASVSSFANAWIELIDPQADSSDLIVGSTSFFDPTGQADRWLITPPIILGTFGNVAYWEAKSHDPSFPDTYMVLVSTTDTQLSSFTDTLTTIYQELAEWNAQSAVLDSIPTTLGQTIHLAFVNRTNDGFKLYLDNIRVEKDDPAALIEMKKSLAYIYPNPSSEVINIAGIQDIKNIQIISLSGKILVNTTSSQIDVSRLEAGRYIVIINSDELISRTTFVKM